MNPKLFFEYESYCDANDPIYNSKGVKVKEFKLIDQNGVEIKYSSDDTRTCYLVNAKEYPRTLLIDDPDVDLSLEVNDLYPLENTPSGSHCYYVKEAKDFEDSLVYYLYYRDSVARDGCNYEYGIADGYSVNYGYPGIYLVFQYSDDSDVGLQVYHMDRERLVDADNEYAPDVGVDAVIDGGELIASFNKPVYDSTQRVPYTGYVLKAVPNESIDVSILPWRNLSYKNVLPTNGVFASSFDVLADEVGENYISLWGADLSKKYWFEFTASASMGGDFNVCDHLYVFDGDEEFEYDASWCPGYVNPSNYNPDRDYFIFRSVTSSPYSYAEHPELLFSVSNDGCVHYDSNDEYDLFVNGPHSYSYDSSHNPVSICDNIEREVLLKDGVYTLFVAGSSKNNSNSTMNLNSYAMKFYKIVVDSSDAVAPVKIKQYRPRTFSEKFDDSYRCTYTSSMRWVRTSFGYKFSKFVDENNRILDDTYSDGDESLVRKEWICEKILYLPSALVTLYVEDSSGLGSQSQWDNATRTIVFGGEAFIYDIPQKPCYKIHINDELVENHRYHSIYNSESRALSLKIKESGSYENVQSGHLRWLRVVGADVSAVASDLNSYVQDKILPYTYYINRYANCVNSDKNSRSDSLEGTNTYSVADANYDDRYVSDFVGDFVLAVYDNELVDYASIKIRPTQLSFNSVSGISVSEKLYDGNTDATLSQTVLESSDIAVLMSESIYGNNTIPAIIATASFPSSNAGVHNISIHFSWDVDFEAVRNYLLPEDEYVTGTIIPRQLSISRSDPSRAEKEYDGTTTSNHSYGVPGTVVNVLEQDRDYISLSAIVPTSAPENVGDGIFNSANVGGTGSVYVEYTVVSSNPDNPDLASNYTAPNSETVSATIVPRQLTISGTTAFKEFNMSTVFDAGDIILGTLNNLVPGYDDVVVSAKQDEITETSAADVGTYEISVGYELAGSDAYKYKAPINETIPATIAKLMVTGIRPEFSSYSKEYGDHHFSKVIDKFIVYTEVHPEGYEVVCKNRSYGWVSKGFWAKTYAKDTDWFGNDDIYEINPGRLCFGISIEPVDKDENDNYEVCHNVGTYIARYGVGLFYLYTDSYGHQTTGDLTGYYLDSGATPVLSCPNYEITPVSYDDTVSLTIEPKQLVAVRKLLTKVYDGKNGRGQVADPSMITFDIIGVLNVYADSMPVNVSASFATPPSDNIEDKFHNNNFSTLNAHNNDLFYVEYTVDNPNYIAPPPEYITGTITKKDLYIPSKAWIKYFDFTDTFPPFDNTWLVDYIIEGDDVSVSCLPVHQYLSDGTNYNLTHTKEFKPYEDGSSNVYGSIAMQFDLSGFDSGNYRLSSAHLPEDDYTETYSTDSRLDVTGPYSVESNRIEYVSIINANSPIQRVYDTYSRFDDGIVFNSNEVQGYRFYYKYTNCGGPDSFCAYYVNSDTYSTVSYPRGRYEIGTLSADGKEVINKNDIWVHIVPFAYDGDIQNLKYKGRNYSISADIVGTYNAGVFFTLGLHREKDNYEFNDIGRASGTYWFLNEDEPHGDFIFNDSIYTRTYGSLCQIKDTEFTITKKQLDIQGTNVTKEYDGTTSGENAVINLGTVSGFIGSQKFEIVPQIDGEISSKNVNDDNTAVTAVVSYSYPDNDASIYTARNYALPEPTTVPVTINPKQLTITGTTADKYYDGTAHFNPTIVLKNIVGIVEGDDVTVEVSCSDPLAYGYVGSYNILVDMYLKKWTLTPITVTILHSH